jgi:hypothetical protein
MLPEGFDPAIPVLKLSKMVRVADREVTVVKNQTRQVNARHKIADRSVFTMLKVSELKAV